jgi:hypothetical protein
MSINGETPVVTETITAAEALTEARFVTVAGGVAGANAAALGVCRMSTVSGDPAPIGTLGLFLVEAAAAVAVGDYIQVAALGKGTPRTTVNPVVGRARSAASGDGKMFLCAVGFGTLPTDLLV